MPITFSLIVNLIFFGFTLWLGGYLLARDSQKMTVRLAGWGVLFYAVASHLKSSEGDNPTDSCYFLPCSGSA